MDAGTFTICFFIALAYACGSLIVLTNSKYLESYYVTWLVPNRKQHVLAHTLLLPGMIMVWGYRGLAWFFGAIIRVMKPFDKHDF